MIKERAWGVVCTLPYARLPHQMLIHLLHFLTMWLNNFPTSTGISTNFSPWEVILHNHLTSKRNCRVPFGAYCEMHEDKAPTNTMHSRALPTICLGPTGNFQGSYHVLNLVSGVVIKCRLFNKLPAPQSVIDRVTALAKKSGVSSKLVFANRRCVPFSWSETESTSNEPKQARITPYPDIPAKMPGVRLSRHSPRASPDSIITPPQETDWTQLADDAAANANLDLMDHLPPPLDIIDINDDAEFHVLLVPPSSSSVPVSLTVKSDFSIAPPLPAPPSSPRDPLSNTCAKSSWTFAGLCVHDCC